MAPIQWITVGKFGRPHGTRGEVRFWLYNEDSEILDVDLELTVGEGDSAQTVVVDSLRFGDRFAILALQGVRRRDQVEPFRNLEAKVPRDILPEPDDDEFYQADMIGAEVLLRIGPGEETVPYGTVETFWTQPHHDIMVVRGAKRGRVLVPMIGQAIESVDVARRVIIVQPEEQWAPAEESDGDDGATS